MMFLKIPQISQEDICVGAFFDNVAGLQAYSIIKKRLQHKCSFCEIPENFKSTYFEEHLRTTVSIEY